MLLDPVIAIAIRLGFAFLFGAALSHKLVNWISFEAVLRKYLAGIGGEPGSLVRWVAVGVVTAEVGVIVMCLSPNSGGFAAIAVGGLLMTYGAMMLINLIRGNILLDCGCTWSQTRQPISPVLVARNIALALLAFPLVLSVAPRQLELIDVLSIGSAVLVASLIYVAANGLWAHASPEILETR